MSLLLREKKQKEDGRFIIPTKGVRLPYNAPPPGTIRYFGNDGKLDHVETFQPGGSYQEVPKMPNLSRTCGPGQRVTALGLNVYKNTGIICPTLPFSASLMASCGRLEAWISKAAQARPPCPTAIGPPAPKRSLQRPPSWLC